MKSTSGFKVLSAMKAADGRFAGAGVSAALHVALLALLTVLWRPTFPPEGRATGWTLVMPIIAAADATAPVRKPAAAPIPERPAPVVETMPVVAVGGIDASTRQADPAPGHGGSDRVVTGVFDDPQSATATGYSNEGKVVVVGFGGNVPGREGTETPGTVGFTGMFAFRGSGQEDGAGAALQAAGEAARLLSSPSPAYSEEARRLNVKGNVVLEVRLTASGAVRVLRVICGLGHGLDEAAIEAVNRIRCRPARKAGQPIDVVGTITVVFDLT
jgi:TonB family protein